MGSQLAPSVAAPSASPEAKTTLFALTREERELFFPGLDLSGGRKWHHPDDPGAAPWEELLRAERPEVVVSCWSTPPLPESLGRGPFPRYLCHAGGSVRGVVPRSFLERGMIVSNWGNLVARPVAEHAVLLLLASLRDTARWEWAMQGETREQQARRVTLRTRSLEGKRVGIHGFGRIAREVVRLLAPFDVSLRAWSAGVPSSVIRQAGVEPAPSLAALFRSCDILVECEALTPDTAGSVSAALLRLLPDGAVFVNVARGALVDETALAQLALDGKIHVAADVFTQEPLPASSLLRSVPGAVLSPHIAGPTRDLYPRCGLHALENLERYFRGEPVLAPVDLSAYDRST